MDESKPLKPDTGPEEGGDVLGGARGAPEETGSVAAPGESPDARPPEPMPMPEKRAAVRRRRVVRKVVNRGGGALVLLFLAVVAGLSQTGEGQEIVLNAALDRIRATLSGQLLVGGIRSGTLLTGATLTDVRLNAEDGRRFLDADSVVVRYSLPSLLVGGPPIRSTTFWGVDVEISRFTADEVLNVTRLLAESEPDSTGRPGRPVDLGRIGIREGTVELLTPASPTTDAPTVLAPDGTRLQRLAFQNLDLDLEATTLRPGGAVELEARLASLSGLVYLTSDPLVLREVFGTVTYGTQQGIRIENGAFRLPNTLLRGNLQVGPTRPGLDWSVRADVVVDGWGDLADLRWVDVRVPEGRFRGGADVFVPGDVEVDLDRFEAELEASHVVASGWVRFDDVLSLRGLQVTTSPLAVERLEPWLGVDFPFDGWLSGQATFSGNLVDLDATGRYTLIPTGFGGDPTIADFNGTVHLGDDPGATELELRLDPTNYTVLQSIWPGAPLAGTGEARIELSGTAETGLVIVADLEHEIDPATISRLRVNGLARRLDDGEWITDLRGDLSPLEFAMFEAVAPELRLQGSLAGPFNVSGRLDDLTIDADLVTEGGGVVLDATVNLRDPGSHYRLSADGQGLPLTTLVAGMPERSAWTGRLFMEGEGLTLDSMRTRGTLVAFQSRVGPVAIDTVAAALRVERGVLITDTLQANVAGIDIDGRGRFGLAEGAWGSSRFSFETEDLVGLRPLMMGVSDTVLIQDELGELQRQFLRATGVDPDTLPREEDVRMRGGLVGAVSVSGELAEFDLGLLVDVVDGAYRRNQVDTARVAMTATGLPGTSGTWALGATARGVVWEGRTFRQGGFEAQMTEREGRGRIELVRNPVEAYSVTGSFDFGTTGGRVGLDHGQVHVGPDLWELSQPASVVWDDRSIIIDSLRIDRAGDDPMSLEANGTLTRGGESDFRVDLDGLHLEQMAHIGQFDDVDIGGHVALELDVTGPSESPVIQGVFRLDGPRYGAMELTRVDGSIDYANRVADFSLEGWDGGRDALTAAGTFPLDLALTSVEDRVPEGPMDLHVVADSLDAAIALSYLTSLEQVVGVVTGDVRVQGTPSAPEPEGRVTLTNAEWTVEALGVRHSEVDGSVTLNRDRTVDVELTSTGVGYSNVEGTVLLEPFSDPPLDLTFSFERFQAVDRIDVEGLISGDFVLGGTYRRPVAQGSLTVNESNVYVDEFQRVAGVVDLTDPLLFERGLGVDTTALLAQPLVAGLRNPFFDNLRVGIDLAVPQDTWLRSIETNVEIAGDLVVAYDRSAADLVLIGELQALRGSHLVLGRTFEVDGGSVSFIGRPGLNPDLNIEASSRILRHQEDDLEVSANVGGTLIQPLVTLSTDEAATAEADIVSYLIFGQASGELGSNQSALFSGLGESAAVSTAGSGVLTFASGALANQFGAALAQTGVLDYVSVQVLGTSGNFGKQIAGRTQLEAGRYLGRDVFVVLVFRPSRGDVESNLIGGARVEWEPTDDNHVEFFYEDRFLRSGAAGFALPGLLQDNRVIGLFVFRDWGY